MATPWREIKHKFSEEERLRIKREAHEELARLGMTGDAPWSDFFPDGTPVIGDAYFARSSVYRIPKGW